jgi:hypothetical protein
MEKLTKGEIDCNHAVAQAKLASQACNLLNYELKRSVVQMKLREIGGATEQSCRLREIESKSFSNTMEYCDEFVEDPTNADIE